MMKFRWLLLLALTTACDSETESPEPSSSAGGKADQVDNLCCDPDEDPGGPEGAHCCADGSWVEDIGSNDPTLCDPNGGIGYVCEPEPALCCHPADDPGGPEGAHCCADGSWIEDLGSNDPTLCDPNGGIGSVCEAEPEPAACCDPEDDPGGPEGAHCCADGSWIEDIGSNDPTLCDPNGGIGSVCEPEPALCCDPADDPGGPEGAHCCADGSWIEDIGSNDPTLCDPNGGIGSVCEVGDG